MPTPKSVASQFAETKAGQKTLKIAKKINKKFKTQLKKNTARISATVSDKIGEKLATRLTQTAATAAGVAQMAAQTATQTAKETLDQVLIGLEHRGLKIKENEILDLGQQVGRKVLQRAEAIRAQIAEQPLAPSWLKEVRLTPTSPAAFADEEAELKAREVSPEVSPEAAGSLTETTVSEPAEEVQPADMKTVLAQEEAAPKKKKKSAAKKSAATSEA